MLTRLNKIFLRICTAACVFPLWCAHAAVLVDDKVLPWPGGVVHWAYNPADQSPLQTTEAWVATMADTMARWQAVCRVQFVYDGLTDLTTSGGSAVQAIVQWDPSQLASGSAQSGATSLGVQMTGIRLRDYSTDPFFMDGYAKYTDFFQGMFLHELGHLLGLGHSDRPASISYANPYTPNAATCATSRATT